MDTWTVRGAIALVTGASSGIGEALARGLAREGAHVVIHGRDAARADAVVAAIRADGGQADAVLGDLGRPEDVERVADAVLARHPHLRLLVHSAGIFTDQLERTPEGRERMFAVNHLGPFHLTLRLREALVRGAPARVVMVASDAHRYTRLRLDDVDCQRSWSSFGAYGASKAANILFTAEIARRWAADGVQSACFHPGYVHTRITRAGHGWRQRVADTVARWFARTPEQGADTGLWLCTAPEIVSGAYHQDRKVKRPAEYAADPALAAELWTLCERL